MPLVVITGAVGVVIVIVFVLASVVVVFKLVPFAAVIIVITFLVVVAFVAIYLVVVASTLLPLASVTMNLHVINLKFACCTHTHEHTNLLPFIFSASRESLFVYVFLQQLLLECMCSVWHLKMS